MTAFLDVVGPAIWRATWQASALALAVMLLLHVLAERMAPRWRYLLWSVVLLRFLCLTTPAAPFSAFNLFSRKAEALAARDAFDEAAPQTTEAPQAIGPAPRQTGANVRDDHDASSIARLAEEVSARAPATSVEAPTIGADEAQHPAWNLAGVARMPLAGRVLTSIWLAGVLLAAVHLALAAAALQRRLKASRPVTDAAVLRQLAAACRRVGRKRLPALLVTPEAASPCIAGVLRPRIVVPETLLSGDATPLRHVLAHELAHLARGDLWTNWLLLAARTMHWFNPVVWLSIRELQAEREAACDELALAALGESDRPAYAASLVELATNLAPSALAPAMIGLVSSAGRLRVRVERLLRAPSIARIRTPLAAACLLAIALPGLTDAMPAEESDDKQKASAQPSPAKPSGKKAKAAAPQAKLVTLRGRCTDRADKSPMAGVRVRLFKAAGRTSPIVEAANTLTDDKGEFAFGELESPREAPANELLYLLFAEADNRPIGIGGTWGASSGEDPSSREIHFLRDSITISGTVLDSNRRPIAGAHVAQWAIDGRPVPGVLSATTGADGRFEIKRIPDFSKLFGREHAFSFTVSHPDYPITDINVPSLPADIAVILSEGCLVTGTIVDRVTGRPAEGAVVVADDGQGREMPAATGRDGKFRLPLAEGRYTFRFDAKDRVCAALSDRECLAGETLELPLRELIAGGLISGRVIDTATGMPVVESNGRPIMLGLTGPTHPLGIRSPARLTTADAEGRFTLRAAPGENFPYFVNIRGDRMSWDTIKQPAVIVKEGQTTEYDMLITPEIPPAEKLAAARKLAATLPAAPAERADRILLEFRKLSHTVDEEELWCTLMRELVALGPAVVPQICDEFDRTPEDRALRRLAFALRAIGDRRAVPSLIRALPKTLLPGSSDYALIVEDAELAAFMQKSDLAAGEGGAGAYFDFDRPVREVSGALEKLTGQKFDDAELFGIFLSEDPRRQVLQRRMFDRQAQRWQTWWEAHWREFVDDAKYRDVKLEIVDEPLPAASKTLSAKARLVDGSTGAILSPAKQGGEHARHFCDLDTGYQPRWPATVVKDEARLDERRLGDWAAEQGVDLMCITHVAADGTETFVLRGFSLEAWEISLRDLRNLDKFIAAGKLPEGRPAGDLLMHYDEESRQFAPAADSAFIYLTSEGSLGVIEITDRVTKTGNGAGFGQWPRGLGFFLGVRFNLKTIVP